MEKRREDVSRAKMTAVFPRIIQTFNDDLK